MPIQKKFITISPFFQLTTADVKKVSSKVKKDTNVKKIIMLKFKRKVWGNTFQKNVWRTFMKNTIKKTLSVLLVGTMVLSFAACNGNNKGNNNNGTGEKKVYDDNVDYAWEKYDDEVTITRGYVAPGIAFDPNVNGTSDSDNIWTKWYKDTYNINVVNAFEIDSTEYAQKIDLLMATGKLPDVFQVNTAQLKQCIEMGYVADLTELFDRYSTPELKKTMSNYELGFKSGFSDGKLYGISHQYFGDGGTMLNIWYREDWAKKLGIAKPTTLQEFKDLCIAFRDNDPDGNGINDTLALTLDNSLGNGIYSLMFAYGAYPNIWIQKDNGKIEFGGVQPEAKAALAELNDWYNQGIISKDWATTSRNAMKQGLTNGTAGACLYASHIGYSLGVSLLQNNADARITPIAIPSATGEPIKYAVNWPINEYVVVNANCKHPEAVIKLLNGYTYFSEGNDAEACELYAESNGGLTFPFRINNATDMQQHLECVRLLNGESSEGMLTTTMGKYIYIRKWLDENDPEGYGQYVQLGPDGGYAQLHPIMEDDRVITDMLRGPQTETMTAKWASLQTLLEETYTQIICGQKPVDYFDEFVESWKNLGGEQITIEMNEVYGK